MAQRVAAVLYGVISIMTAELSLKRARLVMPKLQSALYLSVLQ